MNGVMEEARNMEAFEALESNVRLYSRCFPAVFSRARGSIMLTEDGRKLIDFLSGAGALNYGHNNHAIRAAITEYLASDAVVHGLDVATPAKLKFLETFNSVILRERGLKYRFQFTGPTGADAIEAALKLSRKVTGRQNIISFTDGYHGLSLGALAATGSRFHRNASGISLPGVTFMPYDGYLGPALDTADCVRKALMDDSSGVDRPAAILVETIQGEGGINVARREWLQTIQAIAKDVGAVFVVDDIQMGCGRTGGFFSFEFADLAPDIIVLSKSLSGFGLPLSMLLIKEELDVWQPGEHSGTFRGNNLALVSATAAIDVYWSNQSFSKGVQHMGELVRGRLESIAFEHRNSLTVRGRGMAFGFDCKRTEIAEGVTRDAFKSGLILERCGRIDQVIKVLPALTIDVDTLNRGLDIFEKSLAETLRRLGYLSSVRSRNEVLSGRNSVLHTDFEHIAVGSLHHTERTNLTNALAGYVDNFEWPTTAAEQAEVGKSFVPTFEATLPRLAQVLRGVKSGKLLAAYFSGLPQEPSKARIVLLAISSILGEPFNYSCQNDGKLVMPLVPITGSVGNTNTTRDEFKMHTDDAALPRDARTEYINLYGIVNPPGTLTSYAAAADALSELDPSTIAVLRQERFSLRFPTSFGFAAELWSAPCPIIAGAGDDIELRFPSYATRASRKGDEAALAALKQLMEALNRHAVGFPLDPGCVLTFNNFRGAHKRDAIGKGERLVFRTYSCRSLDFLRDVSGNPGPIFSIESFAKKISA